jgi:ribose transport system substrate-binding protein
MSIQNLEGGISMNVKKLLVYFISVAIASVLFVACTTCSSAAASVSAANDKLKIGWTLVDMTNPIFASAGDAFQKLCTENGWDVTILDAQTNASTQITQVENFVESGVDVLIIYPVEVNALNDVCGKAREAGVKVFSWDFDMENADMCWLVYNYDLGQMIGSEAAKWANKNYPNGCEVAILDYAMLPVIVERANGIVDAIKKEAPNCTIVAQDSAVNVAAGMNVAENMLQAHPDIKVFACIGDGGAVGANEALKAAGVNLDEYGCFGADASDEALTAIKANEAVRMSVTLGSGVDFANSLAEYVKQLTSNKPFDRLVYKTMIPVNASNVDQYYKD